MANRLIALDMCPGVHPVGVGESLRRILGKPVCMLLRPDVEDVCKSDQLCVGIKAGIEGAIHAITDMFEQNKSNGWGVLLIDASNRIAALWNVRVLCPRCSVFLINTYRGWPPLIVSATTLNLYSREGVIKVDLLGMIFLWFGHPASCSFS
jgi:hypothetical protein